jgi:protein-arginine kinase activator protein McsA
MLRQFREFILDFKIKYPQQKNEHGFFDATYTERGHELRCPNCGGTLWTIKNYQHLECVNCYRNFSNLGVLGMEEIPPSSQWREN